MRMKELILYLIAAVSSLVVLGYSVHMFVTGLVSAETERWLIIGACAVGSVVIGFMAWDVVRRRARRGG
jgi:membrane protein YqaA with SNARE-associated domain